MAVLAVVSAPDRTYNATGKLVGFLAQLCSRQPVSTQKVDDAGVGLRPEVDVSDGQDGHESCGRDKS